MVKFIMDLSRVTLVVPTLNRIELLLRNLNMWNGTRICIIILDGSDEKVDCDRFNKFDFKIKYIHDKRDIRDRVCSILHLIETPYCGFLSDDDFFLPDAVNYISNFLDSESRYDALAGYYGFLSNNCQQYYLDFFEPWYLISETRECEFVFSDSVRNVKKFCESYSPNFFYCIWRTLPWKKVVSCAFQIREVPLWMHEFYYIFCVCFFAKGKIVPKMLYVRTGERPSNVTTKDYDWDGFFGGRYENDKENAYLVLEEHALKFRLENELPAAFRYYCEQFQKIEKASRRRYDSVTLPALRRASWYGLKYILPDRFVRTIRHFFGTQPLASNQTSRSGKTKIQIQLSQSLRKSRCVDLLDICKLESIYNSVE